jgi:glycosyltransferase involved in cell wall biosynthesis
VEAPRVILFLPSLAGGGAERVFVELANEFARLGVHVDLALAQAEGPYLAELSAPVRVVDFAAASVSKSLPKLVRHLRSERPVAMLSALDHANVTAIVARLMARASTRCVISARSVPSMLAREAGFARAWPVLQAARLTYRFADGVIANSEGVADDFSRYMRIPRQRIRVIYNPLNVRQIDRLSREPLEHPALPSEETPMILSAGRLSGLKDFPTLLTAFARVRAQRRCRLVILGEGPDRLQLETLARGLGVADDVALPGFVDNPFQWMRRASVFVSSSLSEGCPNALMQALACGTPVVSTDGVGGAREVLEGGRWGRLAPVRDPSSLAASIVATLDAETHPDVRQRAAEFSPESTARRYLQSLLPRQLQFAATG